MSADDAGRQGPGIRLHHVNVVVPLGRTEEVAAFYVLLGLLPVAKPTHGVSPGGAWFEIAPGSQLHISERDGVQVHPDQHFALVVTDFDGVLSRLARAGAPWQEQPDLFGGRRGSTRDPVGNRVELLEAAGELA